MDYKGQTAVLLAIFVLVGMVFLVPLGTEKAMAGINATAKGTCDNKACEFTWVQQHLVEGRWVAEPQKSGTIVGWKTTSKNAMTGGEEGWVNYKVGGGTVQLWFRNPKTFSFEKNTCQVNWPYGMTPGLTGSCYAGSGQNADFTYDLQKK